MQKSSKNSLTKFLEEKRFSSVLDVPSGCGWLRKALVPEASIDGIDLFEERPDGYRKFWSFDLEDGIPQDATGYDLVCCCEGIEHVGNPLNLLRSFNKALSNNGMLVVTTPNIWYPQARLQYLIRGFFPSFPSIVDTQIKFGSHMHITPWCYPQLYLYFKLAGFSPPVLIEEPLSKPKHIHERLLGIPSKLYIQSKIKKSKSDEERTFWETAGSEGSRLGRHLFVFAHKTSE